MSRILVATDGSEGADRAIDYASHRAKAERAELLIVNIAGQGLPDRVFEALTQAQHTWLDELLASTSAETLSRAGDHARRIGVATLLLESRRGDVAPAIMEIARQMGAGAVAELLLGSVAHKLVSLASLPVIVVP